jgi:hypothetical protein
MEGINSKLQAASLVSDEAPAAAKPRKKGRVKKFLLRGAVLLAAVAIVGQATYTYSGDNQWQSLGTHKSGVTVYAMKSPGSNIKKFKATFKIKGKLAPFVSWALEDTTDLSLGFYDTRDLERFNGGQQSLSTWKQTFPSPFKPREFVTRNDFTQDPITKALTFRVKAEPDKLPPNDCCVRVGTMNNSWVLTPLKNGEIAVEWYNDMDMGGTLPYFMQNGYFPNGMYYFGRKLQTYLDMPKYKNARYAWIQEVQQ